MPAGSRTAPHVRPARAAELADRIDFFSLRSHGAEFAATSPLLFFAATQPRHGSHEISSVGTFQPPRTSLLPPGPLIQFESTVLASASASQQAGIGTTDAGRSGRAVTLALLERVLRAKAREAGWISSTKFSNVPTAGRILSLQPANNSSFSISNSRTIRNVASNARPNALPALPPRARKPVLSAQNAERKPLFPLSPPRGVPFSAAAASSRNGPP